MRDMSVSTQADTCISVWNMALHGYWPRQLMVTKYDYQKRSSVAGCLSLAPPSDKYMHHMKATSLVMNRCTIKDGCHTYRLQMAICITWRNYVNVISFPLLLEMVVYKVALVNWNNNSWIYSMLAYCMMKYPLNYAPEVKKVHTSQDFSTTNDVGSVTSIHTYIETKIILC